eukprot:s5178_g5.t1
MDRQECPWLPALLGLLYVLQNGSKLHLARRHPMELPGLVKTSTESRVARSTITSRTTSRAVKAGCIDNFLDSMRCYSCCTRDCERLNGFERDVRASKLEFVLGKNTGFRSH